MLNTSDIRWIKADTKLEISSIDNVRDGQLCLCKENKILYVLEENGIALQEDGTKVLSSVIGPDYRWVYANRSLKNGYRFNFDIAQFISEGDDFYSISLPLITDPIWNTDPLLTENYLVQIFDYDTNAQVDVESAILEADYRTKLVVPNDPDCRFKGYILISPLQNI